MIDQLRQIAERIRGLRDNENLTPEAVAAQIGIPVETYLRYESGAADIPIGILYELTKLFQVELTALLTGEDPKLHVYSVVRRGKGMKVERRKEYSHQALGYNFAHKKAEPFLVTVQPDQNTSPCALNSHPGQEFNYVLSGSMQIVIGAHTLELNEGDALFFDSSYPHGMKALNNAPVEFLAIVL